jgi:hypothetical protein
MMYHPEHDMRGGGSQYSMRRYRDMEGGDYVQNQGSNMDMRGDYRYDNVHDMACDYNREYQDMLYDGHYPMEHRQGGYEPVEFMGYCSGYSGSPDHRGRDYGYSMRGRGRDYGYPMYEHDYGYDDYGDYGETLSEKELEEWCHKLKSKLTDQEKQMFSKEAIMQRAKSMGVEFKDFTEMEFYVNTLKNYTDHKHSIGQNPDLAMKLSRDDFKDEDGEYKGSEWLSVYYDDFVKKDD